MAEIAKSLPWYHGRISTNEVVRICTKISQNGAFLLRDSQHEEKAFTLSVFCKAERQEGEIYHYRIRMSPEEKLLIKTLKKEFSSWDELVNFCKKPQDSEKFPQPLVKAIDKSVVDAWKSSDENWRDSIQMERRKVQVNSGDPPSKSKCDKKKSPPGRITEFFRNPHKFFASKEKVECDQVDHEKNENEEWDDCHSDDEFDNEVSNEAVAVESENRFIATSDSTGQENEMDFKKGEILIHQGPCSDGWWYCFNEERNIYGWVHESSFHKY